MENIYRAWTEFSKIQSQVLKGAQASRQLESVVKSVEAWKNLDYPKGENWKYVKFKQLPTTHFRWPEKDFGNQQVADDRFYTFEVRNFKTPQVFGKLSLPEGLEVRSELEEGYLGFSAHPVGKPFADLAKSFAGLGFGLNIEKSFPGDRPLRLLFDYSEMTEKDLYLHQNVAIQVAEGAEVDIYVEILGERFSGLSNLCFSIQVAKGGRLRLYTKELGGAQSHMIFNCSARVEKDAFFQNFDVTLPGGWSRHNVAVELMQAGAEGRLLGAYINDSTNFVDHHTSIAHQVGHTESYEDYRGILADRAQAVFNGKVFIAEKATRSNSEQINKNLMLSSQAEVDAKPELQIFNDDVKAAHGATVGQIDEEQRFYLQSRGYSAAQAGRVLAKAFIYALFDEQPDWVSRAFSVDLDRALAQLKEG